MATILDDKLLSLRLASRPEFQLRLAEFLHSYGVADLPALVVQARQVPDSQSGAVDVDDPEVQKRFLAGVGSKDGWWQGFRSMTAVRATFHGIASLPAREQPAWAAEAHRDGHFIAGIWRFPELPVGGSNVPVLADFYLGMFNDFFRLVVSTLQPASEPPTYEATATLVRAPGLHYGTRSHYGIEHVVGPLTIDNLQWPIAAARVGTPEWTSLAAQMGKALAGAYGDTPPQTQ